MIKIRKADYLEELKKSINKNVDIREDFVSGYFNSSFYNLINECETIGEIIEIFALNGWSSSAILDIIFTDLIEDLSKNEFADVPDIYCD